MGKITWTSEEEVRLEELYKQGLKIPEIARILEKTEDSIVYKSGTLHLGDKYPRKNNANVHHQYQDYEWCYERYINRGMSFEEIAIEAKTKPRTIQKWCSEKHGLNSHTFRKLKKLNQLQKTIIIAGLLGDGHITHGDEHHKNMYIEIHAEYQKDYLYWKYNILKDMCNHPPKKYTSTTTEIKGKACVCQDYYRMSTRVVDELEKYATMTNSELIRELDDLGFILLMLDDASRNESNWLFCAAEYSHKDELEFLSVCKNKFGLNGHITNSDDRYILFDSDSSRVIDKMMLSLLPNELDVIQEKVVNKRITQKPTYKYIETENDRIGLSQYCRKHHISYTKIRDLFYCLNVESMPEEKFLELCKQYE